MLYCLNFNDYVPRLHSFNEHIVSSLTHNRIKAESAIDELSDAKIIDFASGHVDFGTNYHLIEIGKKFLARIGYNRKKMRRYV
jgi:hypothetical protein